MDNFHRWEDNIRMDLWEKRWEGVDWIHLGVRSEVFTVEAT
jgi:hypothetical protein